MRLLGLFLILVFAACDSGADDPLSGRYDVTLYDGGEVVATGAVRLDVETDAPGPAVISGRWRLDYARGEGARGIAGEGFLRGTYSADTVRLSLLIGPEGKPELDSGVGLYGTLKNDEIRGEWGAGFGPGPLGSFVARR